MIEATSRRWFRVWRAGRLHVGRRHGGGHRRLSTCSSGLYQALAATESVRIRGMGRHRSPRHALLYFLTKKSRASPRVRKIFVAESCSKGPGSLADCHIE